MKPAFAADAARRRSEHDPGTHAEAFRSGVQRMDSATATSVIWVGHESCPSRKSYPHVAMMQSGQDLCGDDGPRWLDGASSRRVLAQPQVRARVIVVERI